MVGEVPFAKIREFVRKLLKPKLKEALKKYHDQKLAAFAAERKCFWRLFSIEASL